MSSNSILVIGGGNMGAALALRWVEAFPDTSFVIAETDAGKRAFLRDEGLNAPDELDVPEEGFAIVVLAIKPQGFAELAPQLADIVGDATVVSIMAGVTLATLRAAGLTHVARVMPNTPAAIGEGMSAIFAPELDEDRMDEVLALFEATGRVVTLADEHALHAVTAISGSGPAYVFAFMEALEKSAVAMGLDSVTARTLVTQTLLGSALLADIAQTDPAELRRQVTSPGGTTEAALKVLTGEGFHKLIQMAAKAAQSRSEAMS
jgi:pyrroline-5-carboxylate reductase